MWRGRCNGVAGMELRSKSNGEYMVEYETKVKARKPVTIQVLKDCILQEWQQLDWEDLMENLIQTMPDRVRLVIEAQWDRIPY